MIPAALKKAAGKTRNPKPSTISFGPFTGGLVTAAPAEMLKRQELSEARNVVLLDGNRVRTKPGLRRVCDGVYDDGGVSKNAGVVSDCGEYRVGGRWRVCMTARDAEGAHAVFSVGSDGRAVKLGNIQGPGRMSNFNDWLIIADGDLLKYWDGGDALKLLYDDGLGASGYLFDRRNEEDSYTAALGGDVRAVGVGFLTPSWLGGTMPPTTAFAVVSRPTDYNEGFLWDRDEWDCATQWEGMDTDGLPLWFRIRKNDGTIMAEVQATDDAQYLGDAPTEIFEAFSNGVIYSELSPNTFYVLWLEWQDGVTGRINVHGTRLPRELNDGVEVTCTGAGSVVTPYDGFVPDTVEWEAGAEWSSPEAWEEAEDPDVVYWGLSWYSDNSRENDPLTKWLMALKPGLGPRAAFTLPHNERLFAIQGDGGEEPTRLNYSAAGDPLDWSSPNGGGYLDNYREIGAIASYYQALWCFGTGRDPGLYRLTGADPENYRLEDAMQEVSAHYKAVVSAPDDVYFMHPGGVDSLKSIETFGDVMAASQTDDIKDVFQDHYSTHGLMGYDPELGLVLFGLPGHDYIYALHSRLQGLREYGEARRPYCPVTRWRYDLHQAETETDAAALWSSPSFWETGTYWDGEETWRL